MADRNRPRRLPKVELDELTRPVPGALEHPRRIEDRPQLANVLITDRLTALETELRDPIPDHLRRHRTISASNSWILGLNGSSFDERTGLGP